MVESFITDNLDPYLRVLSDIVLTSHNENRPLYSVLEEPVLYKIIKKYILRGIESAEKIKRASSAFPPSGGSEPG